MMPPGTPKASVSVVLPVLNERDNLEPLHAHLTAVLKELGRGYEVIYVDDGSTDGSWGTLRRLAAGDAHVTAVRLRRNFGQTAALAAGFAHARFPIVVTLDADRQNDPGDIPRLLDALDDETDVVCGWRRQRQEPWLTRRLPSLVANRMIRLLTGVPLHDFGCTLRVYRRAILADINLYGDMHRYLPVLTAWVGARLREVEVGHHPRAAGASKYGLLRVSRVLVDLITIKFIGDFATRPNFVFGGFGLASLVCATAAFAVTAYRAFVLGRVEATPLIFLMVIFFLVGVLAILIGFLAEIVIRGLYETQRKPAYYVRDVEGPDRSQ
jgi:glycosyltransferase involved in cell wall biosynthesis